MSSSPRRKRRGNGEGTYYRRGGRWTVQVSLRGGIRRTATFSTKREAQRWHREMLQRDESEYVLRRQGVRLAELVTLWLRAKEYSIGAKTFLQYKNVAHLHILPELGEQLIVDIDAFVVEELLAKKRRELSKDPASSRGSRTLELIHIVLRQAFAYAVKHRLVRENPVEKVDKPRYRRHRDMSILNVQQVQCLLEVARKHHSEALYTLAIATGMRQGEILGLKWSDIDWGSGSIFVQRQVQYQVGQGMVFTDVKTSSSRRRISIGPITQDKLREHEQFQQLQRASAGKRWKEYELVFPSSIGTPKSPRNLLREFKVLLEEAGLPSIRFHDLRHTAASFMLLQGNSPKVAMERLGHSTVQTTLDIYSHLLPTLQKKMAESLDKLLYPDEVKPSYGEVASGYSKRGKDVSW